MIALPTFPISRRGSADNAFATLEQEFAQEKASALGRLGRRLESALVDLAAFDKSHPATPDPAQHAARDGLRRAAAEALWLLVIQREVCGLGDMRAVVRDYGVPADVAASMGPANAGKPGETT